MISGVQFLLSQDCIYEIKTINSVLQSKCLLFYFGDIFISFKLWNLININKPKYKYPSANKHVCVKSHLLSMSNKGNASFLELEPFLTLRLGLVIACKKV